MIVFTIFQVTNRDIGDISVLVTLAELCPFLWRQTSTILHCFQVFLGFYQAKIVMGLDVFEVFDPLFGSSQITVGDK